MVSIISINQLEKWRMFSDIMGRAENVIVFEDTEKLCKENEKLKQSVMQSTKGQKLIEDETIILGAFGCGAFMNKHRVFQRILNRGNI